MPRRDDGFGPDDPRYQAVCIDGLATGSWEVGLREPIVLQPAGFGSMRWSAANENAHVSRHVATAGGGWTGGCPAYELRSEERRVGNAWRGRGGRYEEREER